MACAPNRAGRFPRQNQTARRERIRTKAETVGTDPRRDVLPRKPGHRKCDGRPQIARATPWGARSRCMGLTTPGCGRSSGFGLRRPTFPSHPVAGATVVIDGRRWSPQATGPVTAARPRRFLTAFPIKSPLHAAEAASQALTDTSASPKRSRSPGACNPRTGSDRPFSLTLPASSGTLGDSGASRIRAQS